PGALGTTISTARLSGFQSVAAGRVPAARMQMTDNSIPATWRFMFIFAFNRSPRRCKIITSILGVSRTAGLGARYTRYRPQPSKRVRDTERATENERIPMAPHRALLQAGTRRAARGRRHPQRDDRRALLRSQGPRPAPLRGDGPGLPP